MSDKHYLTKVLALSSLPRVFTFGYRIISLPLMIRALGAAEYGVVVYIGAIIAILESFVDFGVSSAAGKNIAAARGCNTVSLYGVIQVWARYQMVVAALGLLPLVVASYYVAVFSADIHFDVVVLLLLVFSSWLSISINFIRASLTSVLAFKSLAVLDTCEALVRCTGWLVVAFVIPTTLGFALANLVTVVLAAVIAVMAFCYVLREIRARESNAFSRGGRPEEPLVNKGRMLRESLEFLWLRLITRIFQSTPLMLFGRFGGEELVGIVGAVTRVAEIVNFPFAVIGNALAVKAQGIISDGIEAVHALWHAVTRFIVLSFIGGASLFLCANIIGSAILPGSTEAAPFLQLLSLTVAMMAISSLVAPMSDYVGALRKRNIVLTVFAVLQIPIISLGAYFGGGYGAVIGYVATLAVVNCVYIFIALGLFFPNGGYRVATETIYLTVLMATGFFISFLIQMHLSTELFESSKVVGVSGAAMFFTIIAMGLLLNHKARSSYLTMRLFDIGKQRG